ncbi:cadherin-like domain-containing protein, partial [Kangiella sp. HZ709]|uniref:cadherin-like domain-containing protein n=1 Tax=Kangiella sp. HZ709 TaxID=2666328 RepID=UPI001416B210
MNKFFISLKKAALISGLMLLSSYAISADYPATVTNKVTVTLPAGVTDPDLSNNTDGPPACIPGTDFTTDNADDPEKACASDTNSLLANIPQPTKSFSPLTIDVGQVSTLTITLTNNNSFVATLQANLVDTLPSGIVVAPTPNASTTCGSATLTAAAGAGSITLASGATIPSGSPGSCTITVDVTSSTGGTFTNQFAAGALDTGLGASTASSANLTVNDTPTATDDSNTVAEDGSITGASVAGNDTLGGDGGDLATAFSLDTDVSNGTLTFNADGSYDYSPDANFNGTDSFTYIITDADGDTDIATVTITVTAVDDTPTATDDSNTVAEDGSITGASVAGNDTLGGDGGDLATAFSL